MQLRQLTIVTHSQLEHTLERVQDGAGAVENAGLLHPVKKGVRGSRGKPRPQPQQQPPKQQPHEPNQQQQQQQQQQEQEQEIILQTKPKPPPTTRPTTPAPVIVSATAAKRAATKPADVKLKFRHEHRGNFETIGKSDSNARSSSSNSNAGVSKKEAGKVSNGTAAGSRATVGGEGGMLGTKVVTKVLGALTMETVVDAETVRGTCRKPTWPRAPWCALDSVTCCDALMLRVVSPSGDLTVIQHALLISHFVLLIHANVMTLCFQGIAIKCTDPSTQPWCSIEDKLRLKTLSKKEKKKEDKDGWDKTGFNQHVNHLDPP